MSVEEGSSKPAEVATSLHTRFGISTDPERRGPVPLARLLDEFNLMHVTLPLLTRAEIARHLLSEGIVSGNLVKSGDADEVLAGFLFTAAGVGFVFVGELEPTTSENGQSPKRQPTPLGRRRFTAAHELGHFLLHQDRMSAGRWIGDTKETIREADDSDIAAMEREANQFAAELLMPAHMCRARAQAFLASYRVCPRAAFAYHLSSELLVSPEAVRNRLKGLGLGDE